MKTKLDKSPEAPVLGMFLETKQAGDPVVPPALDPARQPPPAEFLADEDKDTNDPEGDSGHVPTRAKQAKTPKAKKAKTPKSKKSAKGAPGVETAGKDAWGGRIGSRMSAINLVVIKAGEKGATVQEVAAKTKETTSIVSAQLGWAVTHLKKATRKEEKTEDGKTFFRYFTKAN